MTDWKKLIGKRVLLRKLFGECIIEARILAVSPSGKYVKVELGFGVEKWIEANMHTVLEVLE